MRSLKFWGIAVLYLIVDLKSEIMKDFSKPKTVELPKKMFTTAMSFSNAL